MPAGIDQSDWDSMSVEDRKMELEARGYVDRLVLQSEIDEVWGLDSTKGSSPDWSLLGSGFPKSRENVFHSTYLRQSARIRVA